MLRPGWRESTFLGGEQRARWGGGLQACRNQWCLWLLPHLHLLVGKAEWIPEQLGGQTDQTWSMVPLKASNTVVPAHGRLVLSFFFFLCYFFQTLVWLIYRAMFVSGVQHSDSVTYVYTVTQMVKNLPAVQETRLWSLGREDPLEKGMATHSSILAWRIPWKKEMGGL